MRRIQCYHCQSNESVHYAQENSYTLVKCCGCSLIYLQDMPDDSEITESHRQGIHKGLKQLNVTGVFNENKIPEYINVLADLYTAFDKDVKTWLDVGCGHGEFLIALDQFSKHKLTISGSEPNIHKQESARAKGLDVSFFELESHNKKYDCISLLNVFSHLPDPPAFLKTLKNLLNTGGELLIETGDTARFSAREHYRPFYLPDHVSFASEEIITNMLERLDFQILGVKKYPYPCLYRPQYKIKHIIKEVVKIILPQYRSRILEYLQYNHYRKLYSQTDMYIRAKAKS